jgi:alkyldihydroxyacetonephosphate synthase
LTEPLAPRRPADVELPVSQLPAEVVALLSDVAEVRQDADSRLLRAGGKSYRDLIRRRAGEVASAPDAVVLPADAEGVAEVLAVCAEAGVAVVPFGGGTSVVGGVEPLRGQFAAVIALDLSRLSALVEVDPVSLTATLQAGLRTPAAEQLLAEHGLTLGHLPQSFEQASLGGYAATRSAGQASTGNGRIDDMVVGLRCQTPQGELKLGRGPASAAGPDLRQLVLGSEGTLGVITEVTLRVRRLPAARRYEGWFVPNFEAGTALMRRLEQDGAAPDVCRLADEDETAVGLIMSGGGRGRRALVNGYLTARRVNGGCLVILGWEGASRTVAARRSAARSICRELNAVSVGTGAGESWRKGRFSGPYLRDDLLDLGVLVETLETAASWTDLPAVHQRTKQALVGALGHAMVGCHISHLYPTGASLYFTVLAAAVPGDEVSQWDKAKRAATDALLSAGGTLTHHHAVGIDHAGWLETEIGTVGIDILKAVKARLDPAGILNPGKLIP